MKKKSNQYFILDRCDNLSLKGTIKKYLNKLIAIFYKLIYLFCRMKHIDKKYKVSICAIFKNESLYLKEWIEYNRLTGIEHFYLYNNNSEDDYMSVIQSYIDEGVVTLVQWPKNQAQMECYMDCIKKYSYETNWLGFIDIDEFIVPIKENNIYDILKPFNTKRGSVKFYWRMFGTSGLIERNMKNLVTEDFTCCWPKYYLIGKCFYNTNYNFNFESKKNGLLHHTLWVNYKGIDLPPVNIFDKICFGEVDVCKKGVHAVQINHYFTKSYKEYAMKKAKGDVYFKINPHDEEYFYLHEMENTYVDYSAYKYLVKLKLAIGDEINEL